MSLQKKDFKSVMKGGGGEIISFNVKTKSLQPNRRPHNPQVIVTIEDGGVQLVCKTMDRFPKVICCFCFENFSSLHSSMNYIVLIISWGAAALN